MKFPAGADENGLRAPRSGVNGVATELRMTDSSRSLSSRNLEASTSAPAMPMVVTDAELAEAWFDASPPSSRRPSIAPAPVSVVGEFLGDPLADAWLR